LEQAGEACPAKGTFNIILSPFPDVVDRYVIDRRVVKCIECFLK
jgi:hypothetical protein